MKIRHTLAALATNVTQKIAEPLVSAACAITPTPRAIHRPTTMVRWIRVSQGAGVAMIKGYRRVS